MDWRGKVCERPVELLSIYPTLLKLCDLPVRDDLDGVSLQPLLENPDAAWEHVALTTYQRNNHAVRSQHYRYIRYADGSEEFYDHRVDPHEWNNLASQPGIAPLLKQHADRLPQSNASEARVSIKKSGQPQPMKSGVLPISGRRDSDEN